MRVLATTGGHTKVQFMQTLCSYRPHPLSLTMLIPSLVYYIAFTGGGLIRANTLLLSVFFLTLTSSDSHWTPLTPGTMRQHL